MTRKRKRRKWRHPFPNIKPFLFDTLPAQRSISSSARNNPRVRQIQAYIVSKSREIASCRRECEEWRRRAEAVAREWAAMCEEREALNQALEDSKAGAVQQVSSMTTRD